MNILIQPCIGEECDYRKLADFKPMMGLLFQDLIPPDKYSFWAYSDYDGLFGSFNQIIDFKRLYNYDIVSGVSKPVPNNLILLRGNNAEVKKMEPTRVTGALMIHRNHPKVSYVLSILSYLICYNIKLFNRLINCFFAHKIGKPLSQI